MESRVNSYQNKKALLIGNGINLLDTSQSFSWGALLNDLKNRYSIDVDLDNVFKPFPLAFDEMLHQKPGENDFRSKIKTLKQSIRTSIDNQLEAKRGFNEYHQKIASLPYDDILTTNYDYSLQKSLITEFLAAKSKLAVNKQERKYSLKRVYKIKDKKIWHIHGELYDSRSPSTHSGYYSEESIMIGYEHYTSYLEKIQSSIKGKSGSQKVENQSLMVRLRNQEESPFWTDIFFTHDLDIIGQGFDFSENHLWWLISFRANYMRNTTSKYQIEINNSIRFYYPIIIHEYQDDTNSIDDLPKFIQKTNSIKKAKAVAEILKAFKVDPVPIESDSYEDFYNQFIRIKQN